MKKALSKIVSLSSVMSFFYFAEVFFSEKCNYSSELGLIYWAI